MATMTEWCDLIKELGSKHDKKKIRDIIVDECTASPYMRFGSYVVDGEKVWNRLIKPDPVCSKKAKDMRLNDHFDVDSLIEDRKYRAMRSTFPGKRCSKKR